jgi:hypothetical protein
VDTALQQERGVFRELLYNKSEKDKEEKMSVSNTTEQTLFLVDWRVFVVVRSKKT